MLFSGLPSSTTNRHQLAQIAAARVLTRTKTFDHISPILASLRWLPVQARADFKILLLTYKALHGLASTYLSELLTPYIPARILQSMHAGLLSIPEVRKKSAGFRTFAFRAPSLWNNLLLNIRKAGSVGIFKCRLKTFLFLSY